MVISIFSAREQARHLLGVGMGSRKAVRAGRKGWEAEGTGSGRGRQGGLEGEQGGLGGGDQKAGRRSCSEVSREKPAARSG